MAEDDEPPLPAVALLERLVGKIPVASRPRREAAAPAYGSPWSGGYPLPPHESRTPHRSLGPLQARRSFLAPRVGGRIRPPGPGSPGGRGRRRPRVGRRRGRRLRVARPAASRAVARRPAGPPRDLGAFGRAGDARHVPLISSAGSLVRGLGCCARTCLGTTMGARTWFEARASWGFLRPARGCGCTKAVRARVRVEHPDRFPPGLGGVADAGLRRAAGSGGAGRVRAARARSGTAVRGRGRATPDPARGRQLASPRPRDVDRRVATGDRGRGGFLVMRRARGYLVAPAPADQRRAPWSTACGIAGAVAIAIGLRARPPSHPRLSAPDPRRRGDPGGCSH